MEERRPQDEPRGQHQDQPRGHDAGQRPDLRRRRGLQGLHHDPGQEPGRGEREDTEDQCIPGAAGHAAAVVHHGGQRGEDVEDGEQQAGHRDHVVERVLHGRGEQVDPAEPDDEQPDNDAGCDGGGEAPGDAGEELRQDPVAGHPVHDPGAEHDAGARGGDH